MTTDPFTDAATSAYEDYVRTPKMNVGTFRDRIAEAYMDAAEWARAYLATQEPTDAEIDAAARTWAESGPTAAVWEQMAEERREYTRERMHACLSAARAARRDEETAR